VIVDLGEKAKVTVKVKGESYDMRLPTVKESQTLKEETTNLSEEEQFEKSISLLELLGLPRDVSLDLDSQQFDKLNEGLMGMSKKK